MPGGGVSATGPRVRPGGTGADGSSSEGESSPPIWGEHGGPSLLSSWREVPVTVVGMLDPTVLWEWSQLRRTSSQPAPAWALPSRVSHPKLPRETQGPGSHPARTLSQCP